MLPQTIPADRTKAAMLILNFQILFVSFIGHVTTSCCSTVSPACEARFCDNSESDFAVEDDKTVTGVSLLQTDIRLSHEGSKPAALEALVQVSTISDLAGKSMKAMKEIKKIKEGTAAVASVVSEPAPMPAVALRAFDAVAQNARKKLEINSSPGASPKFPFLRGHVFQAVDISLPLTPPILKHDPKTGQGQGDKNIVGMEQLSGGGRKCIVYGIGIAGESDFEQQMGRAGCETHAFDCSVDSKDPVVAGQPFKFHDWCIGEKKDESLPSDNAYVNKSERERRGSVGKAKATKFKSLSDTMAELGHEHVDLLKFDIEGFEWELFQTEILPSKNLPEQLSFELHTQGALKQFVPPANVKGKGFVEVNQLFKALFDRGYRVASKELNNGDPTCAEFIAVNVNA